MKFFSLFLFLTIQLSGFAQTIFGKITDKDSKEAVASAIVILSDKGKTLTTVKSDNDGKYAFEYDLKQDKNYFVEVRMVGYEHKIIKFKAGAMSNLSFELEKNAIIKEVEVGGTRARVMIKDDTISMDAKAFKTHKDANVEDLVTKMPGITKENGQVKAYGETVQKVLVDGQEFFGEDANIALKNLPAETVDKVEIYDAMNDRNSFTGFNDGNTTKTMNLKTKAGKNKGEFGKLYAGAGTNDRYQGGGNYNYYNGSQRVAILGMANNINNLNFSTSELVGAMTGSSGMGGAQGAGMMRGMNFGMSVSGSGGRRGGGMMGPMSNFTVSNQDGVNKAMSLGVNYNDMWGKNKAMRVNMSYFGSKIDNLTETETKRNSLIDSINSLLSNQMDIGNSTQYKHKFSSRMEGNLDAKNSYVWTNKIELNETNSDDKSTQKNSFVEGKTNLTNTNQSIANSFSTAINSNFLYKLRMNRSGRTFSMNTIFDINNQDGTSTQNTSNLLNSTQSDYSLDYKTKQWSSTVTNILTLTEPSGKFGQWLINYSPSLSNRKNDREVSIYNNINTSPKLSDSLSNLYNNNLFYNVGGVSYRLQYAKWRFMFGSNVQNISFAGNQQFPNSSELKRDFFGVLPYFNIQFSPNKMIKNKLSYNTTMNVPSVSQIQPVLDLSNPISAYKGNEKLTNEYNHNLFFHYMKPDITKGTFLIFVSNVSLTQDKFSNSTYTAVNDTMIDQVKLRKGMTYNTTINMNNAFNGFFFGNYTIPIKAIKCNLSINGNYTYSQSPSMINGQENMTKMNMFSSGTMLSSNISENLDFMINYNPKYIMNSFTIKGLNDNNYWTHTVNSQFKATLFKSLVWSYDFAYNYNSQIDPSLNQHVFLLGSSLAYKFLTNKQLEAKLTVFDILDQNRNISRSINNTSITDSRTNAMNRYGMFTLTYNFKKFEGRDPDKNSGGFMKMMTPHKD